MAGVGTYLHGIQLSCACFSWQLLPPIDAWAIGHHILGRVRLVPTFLDSCQLVVYSSVTNLIHSIRRLSSGCSFGLASTWIDYINRCHEHHLQKTKFDMRRMQNPLSVVVSSCVVWSELCSTQFLMPNILRMLVCTISER